MMVKIVRFITHIEGFAQQLSLQAWLLTKESVLFVAIGSPN